MVTMFRAGMDVIFGAEVVGVIDWGSGECTLMSLAINGFRSLAEKRWSSSRCGIHLELASKLRLVCTWKACSSCLMSYLVEVLFAEIRVVLGAELDRPVVAVLGCFSGSNPPFLKIS